MGDAVRTGVRAFQVAAIAVIGGAVLTAAASAQQAKKPARNPGIDTAELAAAMPAPTACSRGYHGALATLAKTLPEDFRRAKSTLRSNIADLPQRWLFSEGKAPLEWATVSAAKGRPAAPFATEGRCSALVIAGDTAGCQLSLKPAATPAVGVPPARRGVDDRVQRLLEVYRRAGGMAPEAQSDGKFYWVLERVAADLTAYVGQAEFASICSGAPEMLDFVAEQIAQPTRRSAAMKLVTLAAAEAALRAFEALPDAASKPGLAENVDPASLVLRAAQITLPAPTAAAIAAEPALTARLKLAAAAVRALPPADAAVARPAFAAIEVFAFAAQMTARYGLYDRAYSGGIDTMRAAHKQHCTCSE